MIIDFFTRERKRISDIEPGDTEHLTRVGFKELPEIKKAFLSITPYKNHSASLSLFSTKKETKHFFNIVLIMIDKQGKKYVLEDTIETFSKSEAIETIVLKAIAKIKAKRTKKEQVEQLK